MEESKKLTKEELEFYRQTNPAYFRQMAEYYNTYDKDYYINVVFPLINESNKKKNKKKFIIALIVIGFILMCGIIGQFVKNNKTTSIENDNKKESVTSKDENTKKNSNGKNEIKKDENNEENLNQNDETKKNETKNQEEVLKKYKIGITVPVGNFIYRVYDTSFKKSIGNEFMNKKADGIFLLVGLQIKNISKEPRHLITQCLNWLTIMG